MSRTLHAKMEIATIVHPMLSRSRKDVQIVLRDDQKSSMGVSGRASTSTVTVPLSMITATITSTAGGNASETAACTSSSLPVASQDVGVKATIGAAVGVPLALALCATFLLLAREKRKNRIPLQHIKYDDGKETARGQGSVRRSSINSDGEPHEVEQDSGAKELVGKTPMAYGQTRLLELPGRSDFENR